MADAEWINGVPSYTVGQFSQVVNEVLKQTFSDGVWVEGEVQGAKRPNPHLYFTLIENVDGKKAQLNINLFSGALRNVEAKLRNLGVELKDGLRVRLYGKPDYYGPFGKLSLNVSDVDTQFTAGDIAQQRAALLKKLLENGSTKRNKMKQVPLVPLRLGIISSSQAAGFADARQHLVDSGIGFSITMCDVRVQGDDAVPMIVGALRAFSRRDDIDVVMLMRGGGSKSDLAAFDDERIAMAIAGCAHPVFTGIGHEIDQSIADICAHTECKTPTACADAVIEYVTDFLSDLAHSATRVRSATSTALERARGRVRMNRERLATRPRNLLTREQQRLAVHSATLRGLDPVVTMARGWSITRTAGGTIVRSTNDVKSGDTLTTRVADGTITSTVEK
ncbi:MAG: exodeoxyribonuclease large subunit [Actinomycetota bacterium]|jgi:exodeoxyribonuclease VII large subunit